MNKLSYKISAVLLSCTLFLSYIIGAYPTTALGTEVTGDESATAEADTPEDAPPEPEIPADINDPNAPAIVANSAIVMDAKTGTILYSKNEHTRCYPASITKVMTCLVALEHANMTDTITFSNEAIWGIERDSNHIALDVGEQITVEQCFYGILLQSANEASWGMAEYVAGSMEEFAEMMNTKAEELGCLDTHFTNSHGLHDDNHYTTAYDMALITQAAIQNPMFRTIDETRYYQIPPTNLCEEPRDLWHQLRMILPSSPYYYEPTEGGKTGYTDQAQNTLVTYAKKNGMELICVMMDCDGAANCYKDSAALYDYYFNNYTYAYPLQNFNPNVTNHSDYILSNFYQGLDHNTLNLSVDNDLTIVVPRDMDSSSLVTETTYYNTLENNVVGNISILYNGSLVGSSDILYSDMVVHGEVLRWGISPEEKQKRLNITLMIAITGITLTVLSLFIVFRVKNRRYRYLKRRSRSSKLHF